MSWAGKFEAVKCYAHSQVLEGQKHRCSFNFDLSRIDVNGSIYWYFPEDIVLDVMLDVPVGTDEMIRSGMKSGAAWPKRWLYAVLQEREGLPGVCALNDLVERNLTRCYFANVRDVRGRAFPEDYVFQILITNKKR